VTLLRRSTACALLALVAVAFAAGATAPAARANPMKPVCGVAGLFSGVLGKACGVVQNGGRWVKAGKKLLGGNVGGAAKAVLGGGGSRVATAATATIGIAAIATSILGGAKTALSQTASVLSHTTSPQLTSTWFSAMYWQIAGISAILTMPFLFAAAIQALLRSDLTLLLRAAFGYLPLAMLAVSVAAPITMLLLAASDQLSAVVASAAGNASDHFLRQAAGALGKLTVLSGSPFLAIMVGLFIVGGALTLWVELLMREAAVYVIVLMLPLAFAAMVWPARRIWAIRAVELLVALILSKFAIVAVLSLGSAALSAGTGHGLTVALAGVVLLFMGAFAPWALLRLLPLAEIASSAAGSLQRELKGGVVPQARLAEGAAAAGDEWASSTTSQMRRDASDVEPNHADPVLDALGTTPAPPAPSAPPGPPAPPAPSAPPGPPGPPAPSAVGVTPPPPADNGALGAHGDGVRPQGGGGVAAHGASEDTEGLSSTSPTAGDFSARSADPDGRSPSSSTTTTAPDTATAEELEHAEPEPPPVLQDLWREEHRGKFAVDLGDSPPPEPPPDLEAE
jgi:hypothetical protein